MSQSVVLLDLENNLPTLTLLREIIEHYSTLYLFNCAGKFEFPLDDLTEFSGWVSAGRIIILDIPETEYKEYEYAVLVGQLMALLEEGSHVELISAMDTSQMLMDMMIASNIDCHLIQVESAQDVVVEKPKFNIPSIETIKSKASLQMVKHYCDALANMKGKPTTLETLKNSVSNILQLVPEKAKHVVGMLINLKIVKNEHDHISFRKKILKQWIQIDLNTTEGKTVLPLDTAVSQLKQKDVNDFPEEDLTEVQSAQRALFKNFSKIDPVQLEVARKLRELKENKPKDIYELRDLLETLFPKSDIRLLLKELIEKGYIYWNGHEVLYSHEMFLN